MDKSIWGLFDQIRGELPTHEYGITLSILIYLRWLDFQDAEQESIAAFDDSDYTPVLPSNLQWRNWCNLPPEELNDLFKERLPRALEQTAVLKNNPLSAHLNRIAPVVEGISRLSERSLLLIIQWLAAQPFETPSDRRQLLDVLDSILEKSSDKYSGEFRTPKGVSQLLIHLASPKPGDRIYDPCFGSAGLLTMACDYVLINDKEKYRRSGSHNLSVYGIEININSYVIGLTRLALSDVDDPRLEYGNSLERMASDSPQRDGYDIVVANPPFGMRVDRIGLEHFPILTNDATGLFIQHALSQLKPGGRAAIVVPEGFLFRGGAEQRLRRMLLEEHTVEAVVSLPEKTFMPFAAIRASILVIQRGGKTDQIQMIDAESFFWKDASSGIPSDLWDKSTEKFSIDSIPTKSDNRRWLVAVDSLKEIEWDFTVKRRDQSSLDKILSSLKGDVELTTLKEVSQVISGRSIRSSELLDKPADETRIPYIRIKDIQRNEAIKGSSWLSIEASEAIDPKTKLRAGDVLLSKSGTIGKSGIVRNGAVGAIAAHGLYVIRTNQDLLDPHFLVAYLNSKDCKTWLNDRTRGATVKHLSKSILEEFPIPLPSIQLQQKISKQFKNYKVDVLSYLSQLVSEDQDDSNASSINEWINRCLSIFENEDTSPTGKVDLQLLDLFSKESTPIKLCSECGNPYYLDYSDSHIDPPYNYAKGIETHCLACWLDVGPNSEDLEYYREKSPLIDWLLSINKVLQNFNNLNSIPIGPSLLGILQDSLRLLDDALLEIKGHLPNEEKARELTNAIINCIESNCNSLFEFVELTYCHPPR